MCFLGILVKDQLARYVWIYFLALYYVPYISISVFMPVLYSFHCSSFVIYFEFRKYDASSFVLIFIDWFGYLWSFVITYEFWNQIIFFYFWKKCHWNVMKIKNHRYHLTPVRMDIMKKKQRQHVLARMWRNCKPGTLFVGIQNDVDAMENRLFKTKNIIWSNNNTFWYLSKINEIRISSDISTCMFISALFAMEKLNFHQ